MNLSELVQRKKELESRLPNALPEERIIMDKLIYKIGIFIQNESPLIFSEIVSLTCQLISIILQGIPPVKVIPLPKEREEK